MRLPACVCSVFGDLIADEFIYGEIARVSREAPVLILNYDSTEIVPGGAGNAAATSRRSAGPPWPSASPGATRPGRRLVDAHARRGVDVRGIVRAARLPHADEDPDPRRRHPFGEAAGRPDRSRPQDPSSSEPDRATCRRPLVSAAVKVRCAARVGLRQRAGDAGARAAGAEALRRRSRARGHRARRLAIRAAAVQRHDGVHAERVGGRAALRRPDRRQRAHARASRTRAPRAHACGRGAGDARQPRDGALRSRIGRPCTFRSSAPIRSPT